MPNIKARFYLFDKKSQELCENSDILDKLVQPINSSVKNQYCVTFTAPPQDLDFLKNLERRGLEIRLFMFRPSDGELSQGSKIFNYIMEFNLDFLGKFYKIDFQKWPE